VNRDTDQLLVVDIGGGSTELVWIDLVDVQPKLRSRAIMHMHRGFRSGERPNKYGAKVVDWISVPLGVATLRDLFNDVDDDAGRFALMSLLFEEKLESFIPYDRAYNMEHFQIIGTSGTVTTVAASHLGLRRYDRNKVDGLAMSSIEIDKVIHDYLRLGQPDVKTIRVLARIAKRLSCPGRQFCKPCCAAGPPINCRWPIEACARVYSMPK